MTLFAPESLIAPVLLTEHMLASNASLSKVGLRLRLPNSLLYAHQAGKHWSGCKHEQRKLTMTACPLRMHAVSGDAVAVFWLDCH